MSHTERLDKIKKYIMNNIGLYNILSEKLRAELLSPANKPLLFDTFDSPIRGKIFSDIQVSDDMLPLGNYVEFQTYDPATDRIHAGLLAILAKVSVQYDGQMQAEVRLIMNASFSMTLHHASGNAFTTELLLNNPNDIIFRDIKLEELECREQTVDSQKVLRVLSADNQSRWEQLKEALYRDTRRPGIELSLAQPQRPVSVFDTKFAGTPYLPQGFDYPFVTNWNGPPAPMKLLAQLNFDQLPHIEGFPDKGMLQFFVETEFWPEKYKVVYHPVINYDENSLMECPEIEEDPDFSIFEELALDWQVADCPLNTSAENFKDMFLEYYNRYFEDDKEDFDEIQGYESQIDTAFRRAGHRIGGYHHFVQYDPIREGGEHEEYTTLLLQIDTDFTELGAIQWGDGGTALFFIKPEDLAALDFSDVFFHVDNM